jgi:diaminopimelate epimerase
VHINTKGGLLKVYARQENKVFRNIWLEGEAQLVFEGEI